MINNKHKGAASELLACAWLLNKGYEVYRNVSQHGFCDIVAYDSLKEELMFIDVKTRHPSWKPKSNPNKHWLLLISETEQPELVKPGLMAS